MSDEQAEPDLCHCGEPVLTWSVCRRHWDDWVDAMEAIVRPCPDCGKPDGSFACRIRHIAVQVGWGRAQND